MFSYPVFIDELLELIKVSAYLIQIVIVLFSIVIRAFKTNEWNIVVSIQIG